jgi:hypothetical protein
MGTKNKLLSTWRSMKERCYNQTQKSYKDYGGRGIKVCDRWLGPKGFENFSSDMGEKPNDGTLERIDVNGHYEPLNCRWATKTEQANNKRNNRFLTRDGKTQTLAQWAKELGCSSALILIRIKSGMSEEQALANGSNKRGLSTLSDEQVRKIRTSYPEKTMMVLANEYGVSKKAILNLLHGRTYKDVI